MINFKQRNTAGFKQRNTLQCSIPATPPWLLSHPCVNFDLHRFYKDDTAPDIFRSKFYEVCASYDNFDCIYTNGSKMGDGLMVDSLSSSRTMAMEIYHAAYGLYDQNKPFCGSVKLQRCPSQQIVPLVCPFVLGLSLLTNHLGFVIMYFVAVCN